MRIDRKIRPISWIKAARKVFEKFPQGVQDDILDALSTAAEGRKAGTAKPMTGMGTGVFEIAIAFKSDAYRTIYALKVEQDIWVIHAFQKKGKQGVKTPKREIDLIKKRIKVLKEALK